MKILAEQEVVMVASQYSLEPGLASYQLWTGPKLGAELDGLSCRPELPLHDP